MNFTDEYVESESWLTERIFSQLKEYNPHEKDTSSMEIPATKTATATTSVSASSSDPVAESHENNAVANSNTNQTIGCDRRAVEDNKLLVSDDGIQAGSCHGGTGNNFQHSSGAPYDGPLISPTSMDLMNQNILRMGWDGVPNLNEGSKEALLVLDAEHTQRYIELIKACAAAQSQIPYEYFPVADDVVVVNETANETEQQALVESQSCVIQCTNCDQIFEESDFEKHVCDYDENKVFIKDEEDVKVPFIVEEIVEPPCFRQLRENNARIRKFLKDELKIDLGGSTKKQDGPHECTMCERKFVHASGLVRHMEKHALDLIPITTNSNQGGSGLGVVIKCLLCGRILLSTGDGLKHIADCHEDGSAKCRKGEEEEEDEVEGTMELESETFPLAVNCLAITEEQNLEDERPVTAYLKVVILNSILQCEFCDYSFSEVSDLLLHESSHDPLRGFECSSCGICVSTSKEIFLHWQAECPYAKDECRKNISLQKYFVCNVCENKFNSHEQLYDHRYTSYHLFPRLSKTVGIMQVGCEYCGIFHESAKSIMRHHEEKHIKKVKKEGTTKYRQYLCDVCGKSYTQSSHLWQHLRFHRGVKPFACKEAGCNRRFTIRPDLNDHIRKCHTGERPYHCLVCGKRFLTGSVFYQHRLIHRGERRYGCEECGKRFYRADALKNHQRIHTGEKPYACMYCTKSFRQRGDRDKHIRARHANFEANARLAARSKEGIPNPGGVVYVGNVAFPTSMFKPMMRDIDESIYCDK